MRKNNKKAFLHKKRNAVHKKDFIPDKKINELSAKERALELRFRASKNNPLALSRVDFEMNNIIQTFQNALDKSILYLNDIVSQVEKYVNDEIARQQQEDEELLRIWLEEEEQDTRKNKELEERYMGVITDEDFAMEVSEMIKYFDLMDDYYNTTTSPSKNRDGGASIFQILIDFDENPYKFEIETIFKFGTMVTGAEALAELTMQAIQADEALIYLDYHVKEIEKLVPVEVI